MKIKKIYMIYIVILLLIPLIASSNCNKGGRLHVRGGRKGELDYYHPSSRVILSYRHHKSIKIHNKVMQIENGDNKVKYKTISIPEIEKKIFQIEEHEIQPEMSYFDGSKITEEIRENIYSIMLTEKENKEVLKILIELQYKNIMVTYIKMIGDLSADKKAEMYLVFGDYRPGELKKIAVDDILLLGILYYYNKDLTLSKVYLEDFIKYLDERSKKLPGTREKMFCILSIHDILFMLDLYYYLADIHYRLNLKDEAKFYMEELKYLSKINIVYEEYYKELQEKENLGELFKKIKKMK